MKHWYTKQECVHGRNKQPKISAISCNWCLFIVLDLFVHRFFSVTACVVLLSPYLFIWLHTWSNRASFSRGRERLSLPSSSCCRAD